MKIDIKNVCGDEWGFVVDGCDTGRVWFLVRSAERRACQYVTDYDAMRNVYPQHTIDAVRGMLNANAPDQAARLYPDAPYLQAEWRRAIKVLHSTERWQQDNPQRRNGHA